MEEGEGMSNLNLKGIWMPIEILTDKELSDKKKSRKSMNNFQKLLKK